MVTMARMVELVPELHHKYFQLLALKHPSCINHFKGKNISDTENFLSVQCIYALMHHHQYQ
jgi:hypothetical protein